MNPTTPSTVSTRTVSVPIYTRFHGNEISLGVCEIEVPVRISFVVEPPEAEPEPPLCPECAQHKCINCVGSALDADDVLVDCACKVAGHA